MNFQPCIIFPPFLEAGNYCLLWLWGFTARNRYASVTTMCVSVHCIGRAFISGSCDIVVEVYCLQVLAILAVISMREHLFNFKFKTYFYKVEEYQYAVGKQVSYFWFPNFFLAMLKGLSRFFSWATVYTDILQQTQQYQTVLYITCNIMCTMLNTNIYILHVIIYIPMYIHIVRYGTDSRLKIIKHSLLH